MSDVRVGAHENVSARALAQLFSRTLRVVRHEYGGSRGVVVYTLDGR